jgi:UPF0716 protein FxsA
LVLGIVFSTALLGCAIVRRQGASTILRLLVGLGQGTARDALREGGLLVTAGLLLLLPGLVTDAAGCIVLLFIAIDARRTRRGRATHDDAIDIDFHVRDD